MVKQKPKKKKSYFQARVRQFPVPKKDGKREGRENCRDARKKRGEKKGGQRKPLPGPQEGGKELAFRGVPQGRRGIS